MNIFHIDSVSNVSYILNQVHLTLKQLLLSVEDEFSVSVSF